MRIRGRGDQDRVHLGVGQRRGRISDLRAISFRRLPRRSRVGVHHIAQASLRVLGDIGRMDGADQTDTDLAEPNHAPSLPFRALRLTRTSFRIRAEAPLPKSTERT